MVQRNSSGVIRLAFLDTFARMGKPRPGLGQSVIAPAAIVENRIVINVCRVSRKCRVDDGWIVALVLGDIPDPRLRSILTGALTSKSHPITKV